MTPLQFILNYSLLVISVAMVLAFIYIVFVENLPWILDVLCVIVVATFLLLARIAMDNLAVGF